MRAASTAAMAQAMACWREQQLRIAQSSNAISGIQDHGGGNHRSEQRATSDLVHPRYLMRAQLPGFLFILQRAAQLFEQAKLGGGGRKWLLAREFGLRGHGPRLDKQRPGASSPSLDCGATVKKWRRPPAATAH